MKYAIKWAREGNGFNGQWRETGGDGEFGHVGELEVAPEGGFHGGWFWSVPGAKGTSCSARKAKRCAEAVYRALDGLAE